MICMRSWRTHAAAARAGRDLKRPVTRPRGQQPSGDQPANSIPCGENTDEHHEQHRDAGCAGAVVAVLTVQPPRHRPKITGMHASSGAMRTSHPISAKGTSTCTRDRARRSAQLGSRKAGQATQPPWLLLVREGSACGVAGSRDEGNSATGGQDPRRRRAEAEPVWRAAPAAPHRHFDALDGGKDENLGSR